MAEYSWLIDDIETLSTYTRDGYTRAVLNQAVNAIRKLSADVAPVRHGRWIKTIGENGVTSACRCNLCGFEDNRYSLFNYCPNCGAKMDGEA